MLGAKMERKPRPALAKARNSVAMAAPVSCHRLRLKAAAAPMGCGKTVVVFATGSAPLQLMPWPQRTPCRPSDHHWKGAIPSSATPPLPVVSRAFFSRPGGMRLTRSAARASKGRLVLQKGNAAAGAPGSHGPWVCGCGVGGGVGDGPPNVPTVRSEFAAFAAVAGSFSALSQHVLLLLEPWKPKEKAVQPGVCKHGEQQSLAADTLCTSLMSAWRSVKSTFGVIVQSSARTNAASKVSDATPRRTITRSLAYLRPVEVGLSGLPAACLRLLMCLSLGRNRSAGPLRARTGTYCSGSGGFCVTKTLTSTPHPLKQRGD
jgi:hypothetical protein